MSSPRPWGCTALEGPFTEVCEVFPTSVGVYRPPRRGSAAGESLPHVRGGVPELIKDFHVPSKSSPRPWGCTERLGRVARVDVVFPTSVGVYRNRSTIPEGHGSLPHVRGGVPSATDRSSRTETSSPRPWGCTGVCLVQVGDSRVFPTSVGVYRLARRAPGQGGGLPHVRGGVPQDVPNAEWTIASSPRPWGCTAFEGVVTDPEIVFPTSVGVYRTR